MTDDPSDEALFVFASDGEVIPFSRIDDAEGWMEAIDVLGGEYLDAFLVDGEHLEITATDHVSPVVIRRTGAFDLDDLRRRVAEGGARNGYDGTNPDLVEVGNEILAREWAVRWPRWPRWLDRRWHGVRPPTV